MRGERDKPCLRPATVLLNEILPLVGLSLRAGEHPAPSRPDSTLEGDLLVGLHPLGGKHLESGETTFPVVRDGRGVGGEVAAELADRLGELAASTGSTGAG